MSKPGNTNAIRKGNRSNRGGIVLAELGKRYATIYHGLKDLRKALESRVRGTGGTVDLLTLAKINEALRWEMVARVTQRLIADTPAMPPAEIISALNTVGNATRQRNALMSKLLNGKGADPTADPWAAFDAGQYNGSQADTLDGPAESGLGATPEGTDSTDTDTATDTPRQNSTADSTAENHAGNSTAVQNSTAVPNSTGPGNSTAVEISFGRGGE